MKTVLESSQRIWRNAVSIGWLVWFLRVPVAAIAVMMGLLAVPETLLSVQARELLAWAAEAPSRAWPQFTASVLGSLGLCLVVRSSALRSLAAYAVRTDVSGFRIPRIVFGLSVAPAACLAFASTRTGLDSSMFNSTRVLLLSHAFVSVGVAIVSLALLKRRSSAERNHRGRSGLGVIALCGLAIAGASGTSLVQFAPVLGGISIAVVSIACWTAAATLLLEWSLAIRVPIGLLVILAGMIFSARDWNDNHMVRATNPVTPTLLPSDHDFGAVEELASFAAWLRSRTDLDAYRESSYPVVVVATEGGGLRAAYFTGQVLGAIQDRCPGFAEHVFAISSVSGGSIGAGVFAAQVRASGRFAGSPVCETSSATSTAFRAMSDQVLRADFLSPLMARLAFAEVVQTFVPIPIPAFDRTEAFERRLEDSWHAATGRSDLAESFYSLWSSGHSSVPPLMFNQTLVETGERVVTTPHRVSSPFLPKLDWPMRLSTAATLSARFPFVTPPGSVPTPNANVSARWLPRLGRKVRFVDGAYYENSGTASLMNLLDRLRRNYGRSVTLPQHHFVIVRITSLTDSETETSLSFNELMSPIRAALNAGNARTEDAARDFTLASFGAADPVLGGFNLPLELVLCQDSDQSVPLGWALSERSFNLLRDQAVSPTPCVSDGMAGTRSNAASIDSLARSLRIGRSGQN